MSKFSTVWVFSDTKSHLPELMSGARELGELIHVVSQSDEQSALAFRLGANAVYSLGEQPDDRIIEDYADTLVQAIRSQSHSSRALLLLPATRRCKTLAARLGARLAAGVVNDAAELSLEDGCPVATHMVYGGLAFGKEKLQPTTPLSLWPAAYLLLRRKIALVVETHKRWNLLLRLTPSSVNLDE